MNAADGTLAAPRRPAAWLAGLLSLVAVGTGQLYAGHGRRAVAVALALYLMQAVMTAAWLAGWGGFAATSLLVAGVLLLTGWAAIDAFRLARAWPAGRVRPGYSRWFVVLAAVLLSLVVGDRANQWWRTSVRRAYRVPTSAMAPTLDLGDFFVADLTASARRVERGGIVVFASVDEPGIQVVKRAVAVGGDTVAMRAGRLEVNGAAVPEGYVTLAEAGDAISDSTRLAMRLPAAAPAGRRLGGIPARSGQLGTALGAGGDVPGAGGQSKPVLRQPVLRLRARVAGAGPAGVHLLQSSAGGRDPVGRGGAAGEVEGGVQRLCTGAGGGIGVAFLGGESPEADHILVKRARCARSAAEVRMLFSSGTETLVIW